MADKTPPRILKIKKIPMPHSPKFFSLSALGLAAGICVSCSSAPMIELTDTMSAQVCNSTKRETPCPPWDELYEIQGVYSFDFISPDDELDHGTPSILVLPPQAESEYHYGITIFRIFQGHHLQSPEMSCHLNCELRNGVVIVPECPADTRLGKKGPYCLSFKRDAQNRIIGLIVKDENIPDEEIHFRKNLGSRDFK